MNVVRQGVILIVYTFVIILAYIFLSEPTAQIINAIAAASDASQMPSLLAEVKAVLGICFALAVIIPTILFVWMSFTNEEIIY
jgi:hypothetical protein